MKRNDFVWARAIFLQPMNPIGQNGSTQFSSNLSHSYWVSGSESFPESVPTPNNSLRRVRTRMNGVHFPLWYAPIAPRFSSTCCFQNPRPSFLIHRIPNSTHHPRKEISYSSTMGRGFVTVKAQMTTDEKKISDDRMLVYVPPHPLIKHWVSVLRNEQTPCAIFKSAMGELGRLLMYEASRDWLPIVAGEIQSPMGVASVEFIDPREPVAVVPILRAGLALVEHASSILPAIKTYHLGVSRDEETLQPTVYLNKLPESFPEGSRVFVVDPMLATGGTMVAALDLLKERGVGNKQIKVISAVAAPPALQKLSEKFPGIHVYTGIIDPIVNEKGFIIPGLGDAGDRSFGT